MFSISLLRAYMYVHVAYVSIYKQFPFFIFYSLFYYI
jgi:hypothetical protein